MFFHRTFSEIALVQMEELGVEVDRVSRTPSGRSGSQAGDSGDSGDSGDGAGEEVGERQRLVAGADTRESGGRGLGGGGVRLSGEDHGIIVI